MLLSSCKHRFEIVQSDHVRWDDYVLQHPKGAIFHTRAMLRVFGSVQSIEPMAEAAVDESGRIVALLVSCHVKTLRGLSGLTSRAVHYAEPLCDPSPLGVEGLEKLIQRHDDRMRNRALLCEVRVLSEPGCEHEALLHSGYDHRDYINYIVPLDAPSDVLWERLNKKLRQKIRGTWRSGIEVRDDTSQAGVERLYKLLQASYGRARVPLLNRKLFEATLEHLSPECVRIRTAFQNDQPVASIISLIFGNRLFSWYGGTLRLPGLSPFACVVWDDIAWGSQNGLQIYDFGGAGWPHENYGPRKFKASFGGQEIRPGRYVQTYSPLRLRLATWAYGVSRRLGAWSCADEDRAVYD